MLISFSRKYYGRLEEKIFTKDKTEKLIMEIRRYVSENYDKPFSLAKMAEDMNYSVSYICRAFKKNVSTTLMDYINKFRIQKALELLAGTNNDSIMGIANSVGFQDPYYFSRLFKKLTGMTPKNYLKYTQKTHMMNTYFVLNDYFYE